MNSYLIVYYVCMRVNQIETSQFKRKKKRETTKSKTRTRRRRRRRRRIKKRNNKNKTEQKRKNETNKTNDRVGKECTRRKHRYVSWAAILTSSTSRGIVPSKWRRKACKTYNNNNSNNKITWKITAARRKGVKLHKYILSHTDFCFRHH